MQPPTWEQLFVLLGLLGAGAAFLLGKPTLDAIMAFGNWWRDGRAKRIELNLKQHQMFVDEKRAEEERQYRLQMLDEELNDKGHKFIIRRQDARITQLEKQCDIFQSEAVRCGREYAVLQAEYGNLTKDYNDLKVDCSVLKERITKLEKDSKARLMGLDPKAVERVERRDPPNTTT